MLPDKNIQSQDYAYQIKGINHKNDLKKIKQSLSHRKNKKQKIFDSNQK